MRLYERESELTRRKADTHKARTAIEDAVMLLEDCTRLEALALHALQRARAEQASRGNGA